MKLIEVGCDNTGSHAYPICVAWYDTFTLKGAYYVIKPIEYWLEGENIRLTSPTYSDAIKYGIDVSTVSFLLNRNLFNETVYATNAINVIDKLSLVYAACGERPNYQVENVIEIIKHSDISVYDKAILELNNEKNPCPLFYCLDLASIVGNCDLDI